MSSFVPILVSGLSGAAITLGGVLTGGVLTSKSQRRQWLRDTQLDACVQVAQQATHMQLELLRLFHHRVEKLDWTAWNQVLDKLWAVAPGASRDAAKGIDKLFWTRRYRIEHQHIKTEDDWNAARNQIEAARIDFINKFRREVVGVGPVDDGPVARPTVAELATLYPSPDPAI